MRMLPLAALAAALALAANPSVGLSKELPPAGSAPKPFTLPAPEEFTLPNGLQVTIVPYGLVPRVAIRAYVDAGAVREPADKIWISKLNALMLKEGTVNRSGEQLAGEAADLGGQLEVQSRNDYTVAGGIVLSDSGPRFIQLLADVLANPTLPASEFARLTADLGRQLAVEKSQPDSLASERFFQVLFPDHPYGRLYPTAEALSTYQLEDVHAFYQANFAASRTHLYIAGKLDPGLKQAINASFSKWAAGQPSPPRPAKPVSARSLQLIDRPGASQSTLYIGLPVASPTSSDYIALGVMDSLLGGSFASRITSNIREQKGYTYSPYSFVGTRRDLAYWVEVADVTTAVTGPSLKEIFYEIDRLRKDPPPPEELKNIQSYLSGVFVLKNTISPDAVISQLQFVDSQGLNRSYLSTYVQKVSAVSPQDIQRLAETYISPSKMTIVVVGDKSKIADQIKPYETAAP
jgi:zinc protease